MFFFEIQTLFSKFFTCTRVNEFEDLLSKLSKEFLVVFMARLENVLETIGKKFWFKTLGFLRIFQLETLNMSEKIPSGIPY